MDGIAARTKSMCWSAAAGFSEAGFPSMMSLAMLFCILAILIAFYELPVTADVFFRLFGIFVSRQVKFGRCAKRLADSAQIQLTSL